LIEAADEFERDLIRSAHQDRPSQHALERMLLGLGVPQLPAAISSAAPGAATSGKIAGTVLAKWLATGFAIGLAAIGGAEAVERALEQRGSHAAEASKSGVALSASAASASYRGSSAPREGAISLAQTAPSAVVPSAPHRVALSPVQEAAGAAASRAPSPIASEASPSSVSLPALGSFALEAAPVPPTSLAQEMRVLDAARRVLASGDPQSALATLIEYEREFPNGALRPEASVLKVRALLAAGDRAGAEALARRIIERAPQSEHADAVRAALGARSNP
jgi:TolA-binding protein